MAWSGRGGVPCTKSAALLPWRAVSHSHLPRRPPLLALLALYTAIGLWLIPGSAAADLNLVLDLPRLPGCGGTAPDGSSSDSLPANLTTCVVVGDAVSGNTTLTFRLPDFSSSGSSTRAHVAGNPAALPAPVPPYSLLLLLRVQGAPDVALYLNLPGGGVLTSVPLGRNQGYSEAYIRVTADNLAAMPGMYNISIEGPPAGSGLALFTLSVFTPLSSTVPDQQEVLAIERLQQKCCARSSSSTQNASASQWCRTRWGDEGCRRGKGEGSSPGPGPGFKPYRTSK